MVAEAKAKAGVKAGGVQAGGDEDAHDYQNKDAIDIQAVRNFSLFLRFRELFEFPVLLYIFRRHFLLNKCLRQLA